MVKRLYKGSGLISKGGDRRQSLFSCYSESVSHVISASGVSYLQIAETIISRSAEAVVDREAIVFVNARIGAGVTYRNLTPLVSAFDPVTRRFTRVSDGVASLMVEVKGARRRIDVDILREEGSTVDLFHEFTEGSLPDHFSASLFALVEGKTPGEATQLRASPNAFTKAIDLSCLPVEHSGGWAQGCLITPRHLHVASHVGASGAYTFQRTDGTRVTRTVETAVNLGDDHQIATLDSDVDGVSPAKVLPANIGNYFGPDYPGVVRGNVPVLKGTRVGELRFGIGMLKADGFQRNKGFNSEARPETLSDWYVDYQGGDSGSPCGLINGLQFIFLGNAWQGAGSNDDSSSMITFSRLLIEPVLAVTGHSLTYADLSTFPTYN